MAEKIHIEGREISIKQVNEEDYISLTDMVKVEREESKPADIVRNWLISPDTSLLLEEWEKTFNPNFKVALWHDFRNYVYERRKYLTVKKYIEMTEPIGIVSSSGRYGGTYAHVDIAFEFGTWLSPKFKIALIRDYRRLRSEEVQRTKLQWNVGRELARLNYPIQTAAIKEVSGSLSEKKRSGAYASEADLINELVFGMTAKVWRIQHPDAKGNIRDNATTLQNVLIANLENLNAYLIKNGASYEARVKVLAKTVVDHTEILNQKYLPE